MSEENKKLEDVLREIIALLKETISFLDLSTQAQKNVYTITRQYDLDKLTKHKK